MKKMTIDEFLDKLSRLKKLKWEFIDGALRYTSSTEKCYCPITAVARAEGLGGYVLYNASRAADSLGLSTPNTKILIAAADYDAIGVQDTNHLRTNIAFVRRLWKACRVK